MRSQFPRHGQHRHAGLLRQNVSISDEKPVPSPHLIMSVVLIITHYSGTLKSRHFPRNCPWNLPVQKESWKDISKEPPCPRNSPWNLPRSRKNLRATLDIED